MQIKNLVLITALQLTSACAFSQEHGTGPAPKPDSKQSENYNFVDEPAEFPGGRAAMNQFLAENMKYPERAAKAEIEGKCYIQFVVMETGEITNIKVKKGIPDCPECDAEAIRVVELMPKWIPGKAKGKNVNSVFNLPLIFKLN